MKRLLFALCLLFALPVQAFTPESGWWWNPDENGRGFNIEIRDDVAVISAYVYDPAGRAVWFLAVGELRGYNAANPQPFVTTTLDRFENGQCITCPYEGPPDQTDGAGSFRIDFTTRTTATITWRNGSTTRIRRHNFLGYNENQKMIGEWQMVVDFSSETEDGLAFWSGDALIFDDVLTDQFGPYYDGVRKHSRADRTDSAQEIGDAAGEYIEPSSTVPGSPGVHTIVVENSSNPDEQWLAYYVTVGTNSFTGVAEVYCGDENDPDCQPTGQGVPVRGWRSASRTFVETGRGPNKAAGVTRAGAGGIPVPESYWRSGGGKTVAELTGDAKTASRAVAAARRLTDELRRGR